MQRILYSFLLTGLCFCSHGQTTQTILLKAAPEVDAPVIAKVIASQKVILDAAPAAKNANAGWRQLPLPTPFEGYVPLASIDKSLQITPGTAVHYLPANDSAKITTVAANDDYEVIRAGEAWVTVQMRKSITGYFNEPFADDAPFDFDTNKIPAVATEPAPAPATVTPAPVVLPAPLVIPARPARINPDEPISQLDPTTLPPENVQWQPVRERMEDPARPAITRNQSSPAIAEQPPGSGLVVSPDLTQAREPSPAPGPAKTPRLLTGILKKEIASGGAPYPVQLRSPDGRLIALVDLSRIYISDLSPFIGNKVYIRGQIHPLSGNTSRLVITAESLRMAD